MLSSPHLAEVRSTFTLIGSLAAAAEQARACIKLNIAFFIGLVNGPNGGATVRSSILSVGNLSGFRGSLNAYVSCDLNSWDVAAGMVIVEEAGATLPILKARR